MQWLMAILRWLPQTPYFQPSIRVVEKCHQMSDSQEIQSFVAAAGRPGASTIRFADQRDISSCSSPDSTYLVLLVTI